MAALTTEAGVANLALGLVGSRQLLDSLNESSTEAQMAKAYFASTRNELLQAWDWRFATKRAALAVTTESRDGWAYAYAAPADMLKPRSIWNGLREPGAGERIPFAWELNDAASGFLVLTDEDEAQLIYTVELTKVALWPALFTKAVAAQLAVYLAGAVPVKPQLIPMLQRGAMLALHQAAAADANAAQRDPEADAEAVRVR
jgi:hypothetical protein